MTLWILGQAVGYVRKRSFIGPFINDAVWEFFPEVVRDGCRASVLSLHFFANSVISKLRFCLLQDGSEQKLENSVTSSFMFSSWLNVG